ncbi:MAG: ice-binding family protein [Bacteroidales bacterium]|jgi:gliding motility-associated-like protein/uncharacterized repeat protein (TIGR01451 family)
MKRTLLLIVTAVTLLFFPKTNFGQVNLGSDAAKFVIFTSSGAVGDNASAHSLVTGDVGTNTAGSITGFGNVNGVMHNGSDAATTACGIALAATITQINGEPATIFPPSGSLGSGVTFTPGVYSVPGNATLTLDLILDAQGNSSAQFIIKIGGTFSTNTLSRVKLINGALACNVYWQITGFVSMASLSTMRGNIISGGAISMGSGDSLEGRAFSTPAGAINIDGITAFTPIGCGSPILTGPHAPPLGSAACYTIFSANGALNGNLSSTSIGDVGSNLAASVTGWNAGEVTGILHTSPDASTILCAADVSKLYDTLNAMVPDIQLLYPVQFGHNLVLTPHVYLMNSAINGPATFTDSLYLDAQGNPNGVFVIKIINGALTTSVNSKVKLINGAQSKNVFWMVDGAVSINNNSTFRGTIVVSAGAFNLVNTGVVLDGRALTLTGAITSAGLAAATPPGSILSITTEPLNQIACTGSSVSFSVAASGSGLTYQWRKGTVNLINGIKISGVNTDTLKINPVSISDTAYNYNVVISGGCSATDTSINVSLKVDSAFTLTKQPINQIVCAGSPVSFSVAASGSGLTYQWRKGTVNLINGVKISGVNSDTLKINPVSISDTASNYDVIITGTCSTDTSINVSLKVDSAIIITMQPVNQIACVGDSVSFSVSASGLGLTYQWRKGTVNIIGATNDTLTINPVSISDTASNYNVIITGTCSKDTSINVSLKVNTAPIITTLPVNQTACVGDSVSFSVVATGTGLTYQWRKGVVNIIGATSDMLTINPVALTDAALNYNVVITGSCSSDTSINVSLTVNSATVIITQPVNQTICAGDSVRFFVVASGTNLTYQWRKGTVDLVNGGNISGVTTDTLTINPATIVDIASNYNVVITGGCSSINTLDTNLNSAGGFGILAGTAITSTGFSVIKNMNVGLSPGVRSSITGFPPATVVNGAIYASDDVAPPGVAAMLTQAKQDLTNAYLFAEAASAPAPVTVAGDQGGLTLTPGIYKSTSTLLIQSGDLTLDGLGDVNAVWIFQIASNLTTIGGAGGNVILSGGAQAKNITWQVGSSATIGNGTSFKGNILALTSITMNTGSTIDGRLLARNGAVVLSGTNIINGTSDSIATDTSITSINVSLTVNTAPIITSQPTNQTACAGSSVSFSVAASGTGLTYQWRKGTVNIAGATLATFTINPVNISDAALNYNVVITGTCSNDTSINVSLSVNPVPVALANSNSPVCAGNSIDLTALTVPGGTYLWTGPGSYSSTLQNPVILSASLSDAGIYSLIASANGCSSTPSTVTVIVINCTTDLSVVKTVNNTYPIIGHTVVFTITATNNGPADATGVIVIDILQSGYTYVSSTTTNGTYSPSTGVWTIGSLNNGATDILTITATVNSTGDYVNTAIITGNELDPISINNVSVIETFPWYFFIPEGFSPNGDGINDLFVIKGINNYPANTINIFNRWGDKVFEASPYQNTWNGKCTIGLRVGGDDLPIGTYFYILNLGDGSDVIKGTIYLNR